MRFGYRGGVSGELMMMGKRQPPPIPLDGVMGWVWDDAVKDNGDDRSSSSSSDDDDATKKYDWHIKNAPKT